MLKARLKNKETGKVIDCGLSFTKFGNRVLTDSEGNNIDISKYDEIPIDPYTLFGVECGKGWECLYRPIFDYIEKYNQDKDEGEKIVPFQVKEKWARLEFYTNFTTDELQTLIDNAYNESKFVCEECGSRVDVGTVLDGWMYTTCLDCLKKDVKRCGYAKLWHRNEDNTRYWVNPNGELDTSQEKLH